MHPPDFVRVGADLGRLSDFKILAVRVSLPLQSKVSATLISLVFAIATMVVVLSSQAVLKLAQTPLRYR